MRHTPTKDDHGTIRRRARSLGSAGLLALLLASSGVAQAAQGTLENPAPDSSQSGITVISGWVCEADTVTITVDGTQVLEAAYGTPRADTRPTCGDNNNGFGLLWNFNLFGPGPHTLQAAADGVPIGDPITVNVVMVGDQAFERDLSGSYARAQFPTAGSSFRLLWQESSQNFVIAPVDAVVATASAATAAIESPQATPVGALENPGEYASGIWLFSGWVCNASRVTIVVDGTTTIRAGYGTPRSDTLAACGDTDNGFGVLWNFNLFGPGEHTVEARADGMTIGVARTFIVKTFGQNFVRDAERTYRLRNFPDSSSDVFVTWQQSSQNFAISSKVSTGEPSPTPGPTGTPSVTPTPVGGPTPTGGGATPTPKPTSSGGATPTPSPSNLCGNGVIDPGEQCDGVNLNGFTCETAYLQFGEPGDCPGSTGLACDPDCTFNSEDPDACSCSCTGDLDCAFPDDPASLDPPIGIDCTQLWCDKGSCPCDSEDGDEVFEDCIAANPTPACGAYEECVDAVGCFVGFDPNSFYFYSTGNGICGENQPGRCDTDAGLYTTDDELRRIICTSRDPDFDDFRCVDYCDTCDCTLDNLLPYDPDAGECS